MEMKVGEKYNVIYAENQDGTFESEMQTLVKIDSYKNKEIYIFKDDLGYKMVTYNHNGKIDWYFMDEINEKYDNEL